MAGQVGGLWAMSWVGWNVGWWWVELKGRHPPGTLGATVTGQRQQAGKKERVMMGHSSRLF